MGKQRFWAEIEQEAAKCLIRRLNSSPVLALPDFGKPFFISTEMSDTAASVLLIPHHRNASLKVLVLLLRKERWRCLVRPHIRSSPKMPMAIVAVQVHFCDGNTDPEKQRTSTLHTHRSDRHLWTGSKCGGILQELFCLQRHFPLDGIQMLGWCYHKGAPNLCSSFHRRSIPMMQEAKKIGAV